MKFLFYLRLILEDNHSSYHSFGCYFGWMLAEKRPKPLKVEEEQLLRAFYEFKIQDVCDAFKFPRKIQV